MSQYLHLPIYNTAFDFLKELYIRIPKFDKQYKYLLGEKLTEAMVEIIALIIQANNERGSNRVAVLETLLKKVETLTLYCRIAEELHQWGGTKKYMFLAEKLDNLGRQAEGWKKSSIKN